MNGPSPASGSGSVLPAAPPHRGEPAGAPPQPDHRDDPDIVIKGAIARKQYRRALELLARHFGPRLGRLCLAIVGNQAEAEELVQEGLLAAMPEFEGSALRSWLYTIARRTCGHHLDKRTRRRRLLQAGLTVPLPAASADPCEQVLARDQGERLRQAVAELPAGAREVVLLRYSAGLSFREVAEACGIREDAARQRASAGLRLLRRKLAGTESCLPDERDASEAQEPMCQEVSR